MTYQRLTAQDTSFLHLEGPGTPMHTGGLLILEGEPFFDDDGRFQLDDVRRRVESRLHLMPLMRKRVMDVPLQQGRPVWVDDETFDIDFHVRHTALPRPGSRDQLHALFGRLQAQQLDRRRALWELWMVEGLERNQVALIMKTHHCMVDGVSSVDLLTTIVDLSRDTAETDAPPWEPAPAPEPQRLLIDSLIERATEPVELVRSVRSAVRIPQARRLIADARRSIELAPWNKADVSPHRHWRTIRVQLADVKSIKAASGATVNDVVLAACAGALRRYLDKVGAPFLSGELKAAVPVSVRNEGERFGNRVSAILVDLPVGTDDPAARLQIVHERMRHIKETNAALGAEAIVGVQEYLAPTLLAIATRALLRQAAYNINITNVPGPQFPLYAMGAEVLELYPYVGLHHRQALTFAIISYNGTLTFGITADPEIVPDLDDIVVQLEDAFAELLADVSPE